ncbi:unnamed protein product [Calypogeia fissa]
MFYSQFILAKKGPLGTIWIAAHLERKLRKNQVTETNIGVSVDSILFPEVPIALRLSGHLLLGVVRIYSRKVNYLFHDCSEALVKIKQAFHAGAVDLPPEAATAPFHSITLPETFDLDEFEPLLDRELNLLHSNGGVDHHVSSREQITLQDPLEDNSYLGSQFELDERFPEADAPRLGLDFDEDLLDKPTRETSPAAVTLEEEEEMPLEEDVIPPTTMDTALDFDQLDRMDALDMDDDHQEPVTPGLDVDQMDLEYQQEVEGLEFDQSHRDPEELERLEPDFRLDTEQFDNLPRSPAPELEPEPVNDEDKAPREEQLEEENVDQGEEKDEVDTQVEEEILEKETEEEALNRELEEEIFGQKLEEETLDKDAEAEEETLDQGAEERTFREIEQETAVKQGNEEEVVAEDLDIASEAHQVTGEGFEGVKEWEEKEEDQREVPEYETVMSAPEPTNQEPDVFDMDTDMQPEQVATMDYQDNDVVMEDRDPVLEEEDVPVLPDEAPQEGMADPESPRYPPPISSDELPGDDDVLATLLGRGTPALKVLQTPVETVAAKPRKRQNLRKRKIVVDTITILGAEVMKQQLMNTDDIRRIRRKAPCTRQELWSVQKDALNHQIFNEQSVPGLCGELRGLFEQVYVVGEAKLPLAEVAEAVEAEVVASEEIPGAPVVEDLNTDLNEMPDRPAEIAVVDDEVQVPATEYQQADVEGAVPSDVVAEETRHASTEETVVEESLHLSPEATVGEFQNVPSPTIAIEEPAPSSPLKEAETHVVDTEVRTVDLNDEILDMTEGTESTLEYHPPVLGTEEYPKEEKESEQVEEEIQATELVDSAAEATLAPIPDMAVEGTIEAMADVQAEPEREDDSGAKVEVEVEFGTGTEIIADEDAVIDLQGGVEPLEGIQVEGMQEEELEETKIQEEEPVAVLPEEDIENKPVTPTPVVEVGVPEEVGVREEVGVPEEQQDTEELDFLADTRDTEFLGADDDDLVEEAEDFQDAKEYGRKESMPQDNSGWSARTRAVGHYLRVSLEDKAAYMRKRQEAETAKLSLERMLVGKTRKESARMFFETLVLTTKDYIHVEQDVPYGDVKISARPKLLNAKF